MQLQLHVNGTSNNPRHKLYLVRDGLQVLGYIDFDCGRYTASYFNRRAESVVVCEVATLLRAYRAIRFALESANTVFALHATDPAIRTV